VEKGALRKMHGKGSTTLAVAFPVASKRYGGGRKKQPIDMQGGKTV